MDMSNMNRLDRQFQVAVKIVQKLRKQEQGPLQASSDQRLKFYSLFKQATVGNVDTNRPGYFSTMEEREEWYSWKALEGMSADEAKQNYLKALLEIGRQAKLEVDVSECLSNLSL